MKGEEFMKTAELGIQRHVPRAKQVLLMIFFFYSLLAPVTSFCADRLIIEDGAGTTTFKVEDNGSVSNNSRVLANGASAWGSAPLVLGQNIGNRGIVITNKAASNQKNIYFGWNVGTTQSYAELFAIQEGIAYLNLILSPKGGNVGIGNTNPVQPLQMGSGAYVSAGGVWTNASSRAYKQDIKFLTGDEAAKTLTALEPVQFSYRADPEERHVGFIAEDVPDLVASKDRKGMSAMDVVAVLAKVVQDQQRTIAELSKKIEALEKR